MDPTGLNVFVCGLKTSAVATACWLESLPPAIRTRPSGSGAAAAKARVGAIGRED